jgi:hypothetical protein
MAKKKYHLLEGSQALTARPPGGGGGVGSGTSVSPHSIILPLLHTHFIYTLFLQGQTGEAWEPSLGNRLALDRHVLSVFSSLQRLVATTLLHVDYRPVSSRLLFFNSSTRW